MKSAHITTVFIANRAEVALRIQATCHARSLRTVAVYTDHDRSLRYVSQATMAFQLTGNDFSAYLNQEELINLALQAGADAVHPGYGFLSENADFAQRVCDAGLVWLGPSPEVIRAMGSKERARLLAIKAAVPVVPGVAITNLSAAGKQQAIEAAILIGFPVIIKDPLGGGGKGMRSVMTQGDFAGAWDAVVAESGKHTKTTSLIIEKYILEARHIEVQVAGDGKQVIHLFERECSLQRRHQKVIEEAPAVFISEPVRIALHSAACRLAQAIDYNSIGTVEFVVTPDEQWYFLEMNTRLQVEHGVTELVTGIDLVDLQITIAQTGLLPTQQDAVQVRGHAIQCRVYAENPAQRFMPSTGTIVLLQWPYHQAMRLEQDIHEGLEITPFFDPMIAKILSFGATRQQATEVMQALLSGICLVGIETNIPLLLGMVRSAFFASGAFHTQLLANMALIQSLLVADPVELDDELFAGLAAVLAAMHAESSAETASAPRAMRGWKSQRWL
jgi:acetyl/propionyl-CoA carboxylase alpha subunit